MARQSGRQMGIRLALLALVLAAVLIAPSRSPVSAQNLVGTTPTNWIMGPVSVTNRQAVSLSYVNNSTGPITVGMEIYGSRVNGNTWNAATLLAAQKATVLAPGAVIIVNYDWNAAGGLGNGERAQVFGRLHVTGIVVTGGCPASLVVTDLLGVVPPQLADPRPDPVLGQAVITQDSHFNPVVISNRLAVVMSFANTYPVPVRVSMQILGGRGPGPVINTAVLASRTDLLVGPGEGVLLPLNIAALGLGATDRAQIFGRLRVTGSVDPLGQIVASLQIMDQLGLLPALGGGAILDPSR